MTNIMRIFARELEVPSITDEHLTTGRSTVLLSCNAFIALLIVSVSFMIRHRYHFCSGAAADATNAVLPGSANQNRRTNAGTVELYLPSVVCLCSCSRELPEDCKSESEMRLSLVWSMVVKKILISDGMVGADISVRASPSVEALKFRSFRRQSPSTESAHKCLAAYGFLRGGAPSLMCNKVLERPRDRN